MSSLSCLRLRHLSLVLVLGGALSAFGTESHAEGPLVLHDGRDCGVIGTAFFTFQERSVRALALFEFETTRLTHTTQSCAEGNPKTYGNMRAALGLPPAAPPKAVAPSSPGSPSTPNAPSKPKGRGGAAVVTSTAAGGQRCAPDVEYTNYKQAEGDWAEKPVQPGYMKFERTSCHLVAWTTALGYYGYDYNPEQLRDELNRTDGWRSGKGGKVHPSRTALQALTKGGKFAKTTGLADHGKHNAAALEAVRRHFCVDRKGEPMVGNVDYESDDDDRGNHFVTIIGFQDGEPLVLDPGSADTDKSRVSGAKLTSNKSVKTGVLLNDVRRPKQGHYYLTGLEFVE